LRTLSLTLAAVAALAAGCGDDELAATSSGPKTGTTVAVPAAPGSYSPVSDVFAHGAIGKDVAAIRALLDPAAGGAPEFDAAEKIWTAGTNSKKDDGSVRTLAGFVEDATTGERVLDALRGSGAASDLDAPARAEWIDKGMTVALKVKVLEELEAAAAKVEAREVDPAEGAPHNVDEAWAFFVAEEEGVGLTAAKRAKDFGLPEDELGDAALTGLAAAQRAAVAGDAAALRAATETVRGALNRVFALAVKKYAAEGIGDDVARQEGVAFSWGLTGELPAGARKIVRAAFAEGAGTEQVAALDAVLDRQATALGISGPLPDYEDAG